MPLGVGYLSDTLGVLLNLDNAQSAFVSEVTQLSTGLRINSAADDPSGNAIATSLQTKSLSLQQGTVSIQNADSVLNVAGAAVAQINDILIRMRTLVVEANSTVNSASDLANIQTEIDQLLHEIDHIAQTTTFNGLNLLDGSLTSQAASIVDTPISIFNTASDGQNVSAGPLITAIQFQPGAPTIAFNFDVLSYDPASNLLTVSVEAESNAAGFGPQQYQTFTIANGTYYPSAFGSPPTPPPPGEPSEYVISNADSSYNYVGFNLANLTPADVGLSAAYTNTPTQAYVPGSGLTVNTGDAEGSTVTGQIGALTTYNLGIAGLQVGDPLQNEASEALLDNALTEVTTQQAQLGSQIVALNVAAANNQTYNVNLEAGQSDLADLNVARATTAFTQTQLLVNVGTSILAQLSSGSQTLTGLLVEALA